MLAVRVGEGEGNLMIRGGPSRSDAPSSTLGVSLGGNGSCEGTTGAVLALWNRLRKDIGLHASWERERVLYGFRRSGWHAENTRLY